MTRPIFDGFYSLMDLKSGSITLYDVALAHDAIAVYNENRRRAASQ